MCGGATVPACCVVVVTIPCCSLYACSCRYLRVSWFLSRYCSICGTDNTVHTLQLDILKHMSCFLKRGYLY